MLVLVAVAAVCALALLVDGRTAVLGLAGTLVVMAGLRLVVPDNAVPFARSRAVDVVLLLVLAAALTYLSPWGNATLPADA